LDFYDPEPSEEFTVSSNVGGEDPLVSFNAFKNQSSPLVSHQSLSPFSMLSSSFSSIMESISSYFPYGSPSNLSALHSIFYDPVVASYHPKKDLLAICAYKKHIYLRSMETKEFLSHSFLHSNQKDISCIEWRPFSVNSFAVGCK